ncbi:hypothetical protein N7494_002994 [Penicillium frequentans]|uniref:Protein SYM1 n=1 Tax=Penicillium frequentans TaxID=3151616 RepID=A0AAD6GKR7_9EURO|nr:hypothetical protein N7494_002994 [Penicillium glabrum]
MGVFQKRLAAHASTFAIAPRPRPITPVRLPLRRESCGGCVTSECTWKRGSQTLVVAVIRSLTVFPQPNTAAAAAGVAAAPSPTVALTRSRRMGEIIKAGPIGRLGRRYARAQKERPYRTQLWSSIVIYLCGDLSAQLFFPPDQPAPANENRDESKTSAELKDGDGNEPGFGSSYDPWRTVRHLIVGAGSSIPSYNWFWFLHNNFNFSSKLLSILTKVSVQQIVFTPVFNTYFFSVHSLLAGATFEETWERLKKALPVSISNSVKLWPAVTAFSFMYVPPEYRNVFSGVIAVGWQTYLSWLNQKAAREVQEAEAAIEAATSSAMVENMIPAGQAA